MIFKFRLFGASDSWFVSRLFDENSSAASLSLILDRFRLLLYAFGQVHSFISFILIKIFANKLFVPYVSKGSSLPNSRSIKVLIFLFVEFEVSYCTTFPSTNSSTSLKLDHMFDSIHLKLSRRFWKLNFPFDCRSKILSLSWEK